MLVKFDHMICVLFDSLIIGVLRLCKTSFVDSVVYEVINPAVNRGHLILQALRVEIKLWVLGKVIEFTVEELNDFRRLIAYDCFKLFIPKDGHRVFAVLVIRNLVKISHELRTIERLILNIADFITSEAVRVRNSLVLCRKGPALVLILARSRLLPCGVNHRHADGLI